ncbi:MAG: hypothetical protein IPO92_16310 [Saprospiraceae bacterium]|nr:hypothetical protein [Saprospiraceae bacterium]
MSLNQFNLICILFFITIISVSAQYGVRLAYNNNTYSNWENAVNLRSNTNKKLLSPGYQIGVDYWFKLKKRRIEFMPEIFYSQSKTNYDGTGTLEAIKANAIGFNFHTQIYALDLEGDCDCPTFSKEGASINKGLFFHFTPGLMQHTTTATFAPTSSFAVNPIKHTVFRVGVGVGIDFGMSDFLTITPIVSYYFNSSMAWDEYLQSKANLSQLQFTLRLGFRPDYGRKRFR